MTAHLSRGESVQLCSTSSTCFPNASTATCNSNGWICPAEIVKGFRNCYKPPLSKAK